MGEGFRRKVCLGFVRVWREMLDHEEILAQCKAQGWRVGVEHASLQTSRSLGVQGYAELSTPHGMLAILTTEASTLKLQVFPRAGLSCVTFVWLRPGKALDIVRRVHARQWELSPQGLVELLHDWESLLEASPMIWIGREVVVEERAFLEQPDLLHERMGAFAQHYDMGVLASEQGELEQALHAFERVTILRPNFAPAWHHHGDVLARMGAYQEARDSLERAVALYAQDALTHPEDAAHALYWQASALCALSRHDEAVKALGEAVRLQPEYASQLPIEPDFVSLRERDDFQALL